MKRIYLMRHSKAGQTDKNMLSDHERTLTKKGEDQASLVAPYFLKHYKDNPPEVIFSSTAIRAKQTASLFKKFFSHNPEIEIKTFQDLYVTSPEQILDIINRCSDDYKSILIISHCPGLQEFAVSFARSGDKTKFREMRANFPPGSFATFNSEVKNWYEITNNSAILLDFVNGKKL
ncbi:MAG: histidine phosphatase family protein [Rickettsiales bacterium]|nr:histidine phosphatase family protein [Rickettsiales bacterium]